MDLMFRREFCLLYFIPKGIVYLYLCEAFLHVIDVSRMDITGRVRPALTLVSFVLIFCERVISPILPLFYSLF